MYSRLKPGVEFLILEEKSVQKYFAQEMPEICVM
jgi:hypothetical protein